MQKLTRSTLVPAAVAALALSACGSEAPSAAPPTAADDGGDESPVATQSEETPPEESSPAPTSPESSEEGGADDTSGKCESTSMFKILRGGVTPKERSKAQTVDRKIGDGSAEVRIGTPKVDTSGGDKYFPGSGMQTVVFPVTVAAKTGTYVLSEQNIGLTDKSDEPCQRDNLNKVVPKTDEIPVKTLQQGEKLSGKVGFAIPAGAKLEDYTVVYAEESSGKADIAWKAA